MSTEPVEAMGKLAASRDWRQTKPEWDGPVHATPVDVTAAPFLSDGSRLSPLAQLVATLQTLRESDPAKYAQVTRQIATNLLSAAQIAESLDNYGPAGQLAQLAADFVAASANGQLDTLLKDLSQLAGDHSASGPGARIGGTDARVLAFVRTSESHSVRNAMLDEATLFVGTVSTVVIGAGSA
jgi:hypothetical protein